MVRSEARAVVQVNPREELGDGESLLWSKAQDLGRIPAALHQAAPKIALEGHHRPGCQRLLQSNLALLKYVCVLTPLGEQRRKNVCE
jgi:hypothetical protein